MGFRFAACFNSNNKKQEEPGIYQKRILGETGF